MKKFYCAILLMFITAPSMAVQIYAHVDKSKPIYASESFAYRIIIDGERKAGQPDLEPLKKFNPQFDGQQDVSQTSITIVNNRKSEKVTKRFVMQYLLTIPKEGKYTLPSINIVLDGKTYKTNPVEVEITKPGQTDKMDIETVFSRQECYAGEPVVMQVNWYVWLSIAQRVGFIDKIAFNVPVLQSEDFFIEEVAGIDKSNLRTFNINGQSLPAQQKQVEHNGVDCIQVSFSKILIPRKTGTVKIDPVTVSADIAVESVRSRDPFSSSFFGPRYRYGRFADSSEGFTLNVKPLPRADKPDDFYGLIGEYKIETSAAPTQVTVGEPITLTIKIGGSKYLAPVQWPDLESIDAMADSFKIPADRASPEIKNGYKVFTQTIRAARGDVTEIPGIPVSYFDTRAGRYVTARSDPIKLEVRDTGVVTAGDVISNTYQSASSREVEAVKKGLSANYEDVSVLKNRLFVPSAGLIQPGAAACWGGGLLLVIVNIIMKVRTNTSQEKILAKRRKSALAAAKKNIKKSLHLEQEEKRQLLSEAMKQYIADKTGKTAGSLTSLDCRQIMLDNAVNENAALRYSEIIESLEASAYSGRQIEVDENIGREILDLTASIEKQIK